MYMSKLNRLKLTLISLSIVSAILLGVLSTYSSVNAEQKITLTAETRKSSSVLLTWNSDSVDSLYIIERSDTSDGPFTPIATLSEQAGEVSCYDITSVKDKTYYYRVAKIVDKTPVLYSNTVKITVTDTRQENTEAPDDSNTKDNKSKNKINPKKKMVALTYDDGPGPYTNAIVKCLKKNDSRATFFVLGSRIDTYKKQLKAANAAGCEIANHTYSHGRLIKMSEKDIKKEIADTDEKIKKITGKETNLLRTPYGETSSLIKKSAGKPIILWSLDTLDWKTRDRDKNVNAVISRVKDGDIILMHDIHKPTKDASLIIIPRLKKMGYQLVTVSELAQYRGYKLKKGNVYYNLKKKK